MIDTEQLEYVYDDRSRGLVMDWLIVVNATEKFQISLPVKQFCSLSLHKNRKRYEFGWSERA